MMQRMPALCGVHHVKIPVRDLAVRRDPDRAALLARFDPVASAVATRAELEAWVTHLDEHGIEHGPIVNGHIARVLGFSDPDGIEVRLYTLERPGSS